MNDNTISSLNDALLVLQTVAANPERGLSELARLTGLNKSRVYRMLCTLQQNHFVQQDALSGVYVLGYAALVLGQAARGQVGLSRAADAVADELMAQFNENLQLRIIEGQQSVQIWRRVSSQSLQVRSSIGNRRDLGAGASGKVLLAFASDDVQAALLPSLAWQPEKQLELAKIRAQGFAVSLGELTMGICAFAAPVFDESGQCVACLSLSAPQSRTDDERAQAILQAICQAAHQMSLSLGFQAA